MSDESALREKAREAMGAGRLPDSPPEHVWGGRGMGTPCAICQLPVTPDEVEFELEFAAWPGPGEPEGCHIHIRCFAAWEFERQRSGRLRDARLDGKIDPHERDTSSGSGSAGSLEADPR